MIRIRGETSHFLSYDLIKSSVSFLLEIKTAGNSPSKKLLKDAGPYNFLDQDPVRTYIVVNEHNKVLVWRFPGIMSSEVYKDHMEEAERCAVLDANKRSFNWEITSLVGHYGFTPGTGEKLIIPKTTVCLTYTETAISEVSNLNRILAIAGRRT